MDLKMLQKITRGATGTGELNMSPEEMEDTIDMLSKYAGVGLDECHNRDHVFDAIRALMYVASGVEMSEGQKGLMQDVMNTSIGMGVEIGKEIAKHEQQNS